MYESGAGANSKHSTNQQTADEVERANEREHKQKHARGIRRQRSLLLRMLPSQHECSGRAMVYSCWRPPRLVAIDIRDPAEREAMVAAVRERVDPSQ